MSPQQRIPQVRSQSHGPDNSHDLGETLGHGAGDVVLRLTGLPRVPTVDTNHRWVAKSSRARNLWPRLSGSRLTWAALLVGVVVAVFAPAAVASPNSGCFVDNTQSAFQSGSPTGCDLTAAPGAVQLASNVGVDQQNATVTNNGFAFTSTTWGAQTFTAGVSGPVTQIDLDLFCSGCTGTTPNLTVALRATTGSPAVPTGPDLATGSIAGFSSNAGGYFTASFASPATVTAGTVYAIVLRPNSNPSAGVYAYLCSCSTNTNPYTAGQRASSTNSGTTWTPDTTAGGRDLGFRVWVNGGGFLSAGTFVSSVKDANPSSGLVPNWTTLGWTSSEPAGTSVKFQVAGANNSAGPFVFIGPDSTSATFFTSSGADLSQFNGLRYLEYKAYLSTGDSTVSPQLMSISLCYANVTPSTSTSVSSSGNPSVSGQSVTFTASVSVVAPGVGTPTGTVTFLDGGVSLGTGTLSGGVATLTISTLAVGSHTITTSYGGDANVNGSAGSLLANPQVVNQADTATSVSSAGNPSVYGEAVTFTAAVSVVAPGAGPPTGSVLFSDGGTAIGTVTLSGGVATVTTSALAVGDDTITANYVGDPNDISSMSTDTQTVNRADTATSVSSAGNPSVYGQSVTFTASVIVLAPGAGEPTGTVTFVDGSTPIGFGTLSGGLATVTISTLPVGVHLITTSYGGDPNYNPAGSSNSLFQDVNKADTTLTESGPQAPVAFGDPVTVVASVSADSPGAGIPTGNVTFADGGSPIGTVALSNGVATFTTSALAAGSHTITTSYGGDGNDNPSTGSLTGVSAPVVGAPSASISSPAANQTYAPDQVVATAFACSEASNPNGPGIQSCSDSNGGSGTGGQLDTSATGPHTYTVTATSLDGLAATVSISYAVIGAPLASISSPADHQTYAINQVVATAFGCSEASNPNGPGIQSCSDSNGGSGTGGQLATSTTGVHTYAVTATSQDSLSAMASISYTVVGAPSASITTPADNQTYGLNQVVVSGFACHEASTPNGPGIQSCSDSGGGSAPSGQLDTSTTGLHTYTVTATSQDALTASAGISYRVVGAPSASITSPAPDQTYELDQVVPTAFGCSEASNPNGPGMQSCSDSDGGSAPSGQLDTSTSGVHTYTVTATSQDALTASAGISYTVVGAPSASITSPAPDQTYELNQVVPTAFGCSEASNPNGPGMQSCSDSDGGSAPSGQLDTSTSGVHTYTVAAISRDGLSAMASISYTVLGAPSASIAVPASGARYTRGQVVKARYSCQGAKNGPGISSCTGTIANGYQIDTTHPGRHQFAVTATSKDGARTTTKVCYMVVAPSNRLTVSHIHSHPDGTSEFDVKIPGPGRLEVFESPWMLHAARVGTVRLSPAPDGFGFSLAHLRTKNAGTIRFEVVPAGGGQRRAPQYFGPHRTITLWVTYRPDHGTARTVGVFRVPIPVGVNRPPRDEPENGVSVEVIR